MTKHLFCVLFFAIFTTYSAHAQNRKPISKTHLSLWPGFSNHGAKEISNTYKISLNLTSGITGRVNGFELSLISNYNYFTFQGIQFAGLANISGINNRVNPKDPFDETFRGIQFAGIINKTIANGVGAQISTFNVTGGDFTGLQLGGLINKAGSLIGIQLAGLINSAPNGISGFQLASLFNYSGGQSNGMQLALFNYCSVGGYTSNRLKIVRDFFQIGLINISKINNGNQIGILNITGKNNGVPLGILNIDASKGYFSLRTDDVFLSSLVLSSGSRYYLNTFKVGYNYSINNLPTWGLSYGLEKEWEEKSLNVRWIFDVGLHLVQLKEQGKAFFKGNRLLRAEAIYSRKVKRKFIELGVALNYEINPFTQENSNLLNIKGSRLHPGLILGIR